MVVTAEELFERLNRHEDDDLVRLLHSGDLTELAQDVAATILRRRDIDPCQPPAIPEAMPRSTRSRPPKSTGERPSSLWWVYFGFYVVLAAFVTFTNFRLGNFSPHLLPATAPSYCIDLICLIGLFGYMRSRGFLARGFWQVILGVYVVKIVGGEAVLIYALHSVALEGRTDYVALRGLLGLPIAIPMMVALWFYAFGSSELWRAKHWRRCG